MKGLRVNRLIRIGMWLLWGLAFIAVTLEWIGATVEGGPLIWELVDLEPETRFPATWAIVATLAGYVAILGALFSMCWHIDRILKPGLALAFGQLAGALSGLAWALLAFWAGFLLGSAVGPWLMLVSVGSEMTSDNFPTFLGLEVMFLFLAVALFAIARALREAARVAEENKQFI